MNRASSDSFRDFCDTGFAPQQEDPEKCSEALPKTAAVNSQGPKKTRGCGLSGRLAGKTPGAPLDFDLFDSSLSLESLFGNLSGAALLEQMLMWFQDCELDVPWYDSDEGADSRCRTVSRSPLSRQLQEGSAVHESHLLRGLVAGRVRTA